MKPMKISVSFLLLIVMLMGSSLIAQDNATRQVTSVKTEFGVDGEIMINGNGVSGKISIGTDTSKNGVIGYSFTLNWIRGSGSGVGGSEVISVGTGTYGGNDAHIEGKFTKGNVSLSGSVNSDGKYAMDAEVSGANGLKASAHISGDDVSLGFGAGKTAGNYVVTTSTGVTVEGTLFDPNKDPESISDFFWAGVFAPGMAIGEAVATAQIGIESCIKFFKGFFNDKPDKVTTPNPGRGISKPREDVQIGETPNPGRGISKPREDVQIGDNPRKDVQPGGDDNGFENDLPVKAPKGNNSNTGGKPVVTPVKPIEIYREK